MTKAEERALEAYPVKMTPLVYQDLIDQFGGKTEIDVNTYPRCLFQQGYEQSEKELELTWEDMVIIHSICADVYDSHRYEWDSKQIYEEVLRRFNKAKEEKMSSIDIIRQEIERPEVDLEEEMDEYFENMAVQEHENIFEDTYHNIARHFYELGKNAKYEKPSEDLEEAAQEFCQSAIEEKRWYFDSTGRLPWVDAFKAGAEWQKEQVK